ncbi:nucleolar protein 12-domain-containing protein [Massariosphaeria phaeospora]|uniref:Nucleolar protein 12-domain-containing protein n=1 Tax=Massariosphaeria phaeospora TaxID=100035 RepID=A0A7C8IG42_9PLEO|nr:nucleolar protein 12-domain-containing protein [Massariosphaeria phaeospora]
MPPASKKGKTSSSAPDQISFDPSAREEYLTGFHKRKQARIKHAQDEAAKREKEEKVTFRRELRQQRKVDLEKHVAEVNRLVKQANGDLDLPGDTTSSDEDDEPWEGFQDAEPEVINQEDEYVDEDKYTTVTIESVGISKAGFEQVGQDKVDGIGHDKASGKEGEDGDEKPKKVWTKERPKVDRPKKKKFRYEAPAERKEERRKQGLKKKKQAQARKSN